MIFMVFNADGRTEHVQPHSHGSFFHNGVFRESGGSQKQDKGLVVVEIGGSPDSLQTVDKGKAYLSVVEVEVEQPGVSLAGQGLVELLRDNARRANPVNGWSLLP